MRRALSLPHVGWGLLIWLPIPFLMIWALRAIPLPELGATLSRLGGLQIAALIAANVLVVLTFSGRWWAILRGQGYAVPYLKLAGYRLAAFSISYFTPGPHLGGEPLQVLLLQRRAGVPMVSSVTSVALDKLLEMVVNFSFLALGVIVTVHTAAFGVATGLGALATSLALLTLPFGFLLMVGAGWHPLTWSLEHLPARLRRWLLWQRLAEAVRTGEEQAAHLCRERPFSLLSALGMSLLSWGALLTEYWLALHFLGFDATLAQLISIVTAARVAILMPLPGGWGTLEASQAVMFETLGLNPAIGLSLALLVHARDVLFAGLGLWWGGATLSQ